MFRTVRVISDHGRRWDHAINVCKQLDLDCLHAPAVILSNEDAKACTKRGYHNRFTRGAVGCYQAHLDAWKEVSELEDGWHLILEDDIALPNAPITTVTDKMTEHVNKYNDKEMIHFGTYQPAPNYEATHAYAVTPIGAKKLLDLTPKCGDMDQPIDHITQAACRKNKVACAPHTADLPNSADTQFSGIIKQMRTNGENPSMVR